MKSLWLQKGARNILKHIICKHPVLVKRKQAKTVVLLRVCVLSHTGREDLVSLWKECNHLKGRPCAKEWLFQTAFDIKWAQPILFNFYLICINPVEQRRDWHTMVSKVVRPALTKKILPHLGWNAVIDVVDGSVRLERVELETQARGVSQSTQPLEVYPTKTPCGTTRLGHSWGIPTRLSLTCHPFIHACPSWGHTCRVTWFDMDDMVWWFLWKQFSFNWHPPSPQPSRKIMKFCKASCGFWTNIWISLSHTSTESWNEWTALSLTCPTYCFI